MVIGSKGLVVVECELRGGAVAIGFAQWSAVSVGSVVGKLVGTRTREGASQVLFSLCGSAFHLNEKTMTPVDVERKHTLTQPHVQHRRRMASDKLLLIRTVIVRQEYM